MTRIRTSTLPEVIRLTLAGLALAFASGCWAVTVPSVEVHVVDQTTGKGIAGALVGARYMTYTPSVGGPVGSVASEYWLITDVNGAIRLPWRMFVENPLRDYGHLYIQVWHPYYAVPRGHGSSGQHKWGGKGLSAIRVEIPLASLETYLSNHKEGLDWILGSEYFYHGSTHGVALPITIDETAARWRDLAQLYPELKPQIDWRVGYLLHTERADYQSATKEKGY